MLRTFAVALFVIAMSVGFAQARVRHGPAACAPGKQATALCACVATSGRVVLCQKGQWCHNFVTPACTQ